MPIRAVKGKKYGGIYELFRSSDGKVTGLYIAYRNLESKVVKERFESLDVDEALLKLNQIKSEIKRAKKRGEINTLTAIKKNPLITDLAEVFFEAKSTNSNNVKEKQRYENHIKSSLGKFKCDDLKPMHISDLQTRLKAKDLSAKTINCVTDLFRSIMRFGLENGYTSREHFAFDSYKPLPVDNLVDKTLTGSEVRELITSIEKPRLKLFIAMAYYTAQRPESLLRLQRKDIADGKIHIASIKKQKAHYIGIHPELEILLSEWIKELEPEDFVFHTYDDKSHAMSYERLQNECSILFEPYNDGLDFKKDRKKWVSLYTLRHSSATNMLNATGDISMVSAILNHSTVVMTQRYAKATDEAKARGINAL